MLPVPLIIALPIADRPRSHRFYTEGLGLTTTGELADDGVPEPLQIVVNEGVQLMLIPADGFGWTVPGRVVAPAGTVECQLSLTLAAEEDVHDLFGRARQAGADVVSEPQRQPWGYAAAFADPDGHIWSLLAAGSTP